MSDVATNTPKASPETQALAKLFARGGTWKGRAMPGALRPDSPEMPTVGRSTGKPVADGFWYDLDMEITIGSGESAITWKGHMIVGWNPNASSYQALLVDNLGIMVPLNCELTDTQFIATSERPLPLMGKLTSARFTWDFSDINQIKVTNEHQVDDGPWQLWEEEVITPSS